MGTPISRRRVVTGSAWAVPAVVIAGAAPTVAASTADTGCPTVIRTVTRSTSQSLVIGLYLSAIPVGSTPSISARVASAPAGFSARTPDPANIQAGPTPYVEVLISRNSAAQVTGNVTVNFTITGRGPGKPSCSYPNLVFQYPA